MSEMSGDDVPFVPVAVPPDAARDARVIARRAADARRAGAALDRLLSVGRDVEYEAYCRGWDDGYAACELQHKRHYARPTDPGPDQIMDPSTHPITCNCRGCLTNITDGSRGRFVQGVDDAVEHVLPAPGWCEGDVNRAPHRAGAVLGCLACGAPS